MHEEVKETDVFAYWSGLLKVEKWFEICPFQDNG